MKAIRITKENQKTLGAKYSVIPEDLNEVLPVGYILVGDFGNEENFDVLTQEMFDANFETTGVDLQNGFYEIKRF